MENNLIGFIEYNGKKSELNTIKINTSDIVFGIDSETDLPYIYHNGVFYSDASEWSEALPEIHIGPTMPPEKDPYIKLWIDTDDNPPSLKYKDDTTNDWVTIIVKEDHQTGNIDTEMSDTSENPVQNKVIKQYVDEKTKQNIHVGDKPPEDDDVDVWVDPDEEPDNENPLIIDTKLDLNSANPVQNAVITAEIYKLRDEKQEVLESGKNIKTINNKSILGEGNIEINGTSAITIDSEMSDTSANPVQNKVVKEYIDNTIEDLSIESCTVYATLGDENPRATLTHEQHLSNKEAFIKIRKSIEDKKDVNISIVAIAYSGDTFEYKNCYIKSKSYSNGFLTSVELASNIIIQNIDSPYISNIQINQFTNGNEDYEEGVTEPGTDAFINNTLLMSDRDLNKVSVEYLYVGEIFEEFTKSIDDDVDGSITELRSNTKTALLNAFNNKKQLFLIFGDQSNGYNTYNVYCVQKANSSISGYFIAREGDVYRIVVTDKYVSISKGIKKFYTANEIDTTVSELRNDFSELLDTIQRLLEDINGEVIQ